MEWLQRWQDPPTWCHGARGARRKISRRIWDIRSIRGMSMKDKVVRLVQGNLYGPPKAQKWNVLKWGDRRVLKIQIPRNSATRRNFRTLLVQGDMYGQRLQEQSFTTWSTQTINTWPRSSISYKRSWELQQDTQHFQWKHWRQMCWHAECSCLRQWKQPFILDRMNWRTWRVTRTRTSRKFRVCSTSHRNWYWSILKKFWMCVRLKVHPSHGRDQYCLMIMWSSGPRQNYVSTQIPYCVWGRCMKTKMQVKDVKVQWKNSNCLLLTKNAGNRWRTNWIRVEYSPKIFVTADSSENPGWFARADHGTWEIHRPDHLRVNVQRHRLDREFVLRIQKSQGIREKIRAGTLDVSRSWRRKTVVWNSSLYTWGKIWLYSHSSGGTIQRYPSSVFTNISALSRGFLNKKNNRDTIHFNADTSNTELLFRIIHSVNQLSFYGTVSNWCEQFGLTEEEKGTKKTERIRDQRCIWQVWNHKK